MMSLFFPLQTAGTSSVQFFRPLSSNWLCIGRPTSGSQASLSAGPISRRFASEAAQQPCCAVLGPMPLSAFFWPCWRHFDIAATPNT